MDKTSSIVYIKNKLPSHLLNWANEVGIVLESSYGEQRYSLSYDSDQLRLNWHGIENFSPIRVEMPRPKRISTSNLLIRALGRKTKTVADLTAGLGQDAVTIASTGRKVYCIERCAPIAMLLYDGICRCPDKVSRNIELFYRDSMSWLQQSQWHVDAIYIDSMFVHKKKSSKSSKHMQILRALAGDDEDSDQLIYQALKQQVSRVIVKVSDNGPEYKPQKLAEFKGNTVRFDVYQPRS